MDFSSFIQAVLLGLVEGLTEFIPVSSTGHLIIAADLLGFNPGVREVFEVVIQLGAILAICVLYFSRLWAVAKGLFQKKPDSWKFVLIVLTSFFPSALAGFFLHDFIKSVLFSPIVVGISLVLGGVAMLAAEKFHPPSEVHEIENFSFPLALKIGLAQCLAMIPGVSRSGATIIGALLVGVNRKTAAEFSFFLAIPTMIGASTLDLYKNQHNLTSDHLALIATGFITSFVVALLVVRWFVEFVGSRGFGIFAWYRILFGFLTLAYVFLVMKNEVI